MVHSQANILPLSAYLVGGEKLSFNVGQMYNVYTENLVDDDLKQEYQTHLALQAG